MATFEWKSLEMIVRSAIKPQVDQIPVSHPAICSCTKSCRLQCFVAYPEASLPFRNFPRLPLRKRRHTKHTHSCSVTSRSNQHTLQVFLAVCAFLQATADLVCDTRRMHRHHEAIRSLASKLHSLFNTFINSLPRPSPSHHRLPLAAMTFPDSLNSMC